MTLAWEVATASAPRDSHVTVDSDDTSAFARWLRNTGMAIAARIMSAKKPPTMQTATIAPRDPLLAGAGGHAACCGDHAGAAAATAGPRCSVHVTPSYQRTPAGFSGSGYQPGWAVVMIPTSARAGPP